MMRVTWRTAGLVALVATTLLAGCGDDEGTTTGDGGGGGDAGDAGDAGAATTYRIDATVLESPDHGPQLCRVVLDSYPPQCGGPDVRGWDWAQVAGEESANGTTWGDYRVTGTWDAAAEALTVTEPVESPPPPTSEEPDFSTPCPRPAGGWAPVDPATTTQESLEAVDGLARRSPGTAGTWLDQDAEPGWSGLNDPTELVFNVRTTGDVEELEAELRQVWGGALCVSAAERSTAELREVADAITGAGDGAVLGANVDEARQVVVAEVYVADEDLQARLDDQYGEGVIELAPWLTPVG
jgi:hypothetical protein